MPAPRLRLTLSATMQAIAGIGLCCALMRTGTIFGHQLASLVVLVGSAWVIARLIGRPMTQIGAWLCAGCPGITVALVYATWTAAWFTLGHRPRVNQNDPFSISDSVSILGILSYLSLFATLPWSPCVGLALLFAEANRLTVLDAPNRKARLIGIIVLPPLLWWGGLVLLALDPVRAGEWLGD